LALNEYRNVNYNNYRFNWLQLLPIVSQIIALFYGSETPKSFLGRKTRYISTRKFPERKKEDSGTPESSLN
jgi:hypothetical protein